MKPSEILANACSYVASRASVAEVVDEIGRLSSSVKKEISLQSCISKTAKDLPDMVGQESLLAIMTQDRGVVISFSQDNKEKIMSGGDVVVSKTPGGRLVLSLGAQ
jgi:hypothetical protein